MQVKLISITQGQGELAGKSAEQLIAYTARVSNPSNQMNDETAPKLIAYLIKHKHWSPFELASITMEIVTSRAIAAQILRHRSFSFQEFSMRYATNLELERYDARRQDSKNRQNSIDDLSEEVKDWFRKKQESLFAEAKELYVKAIELGVAKECARNLLPLGTETRLYMSGTVRSWIHYLQIRCAPETQKEHRDIAEACKAIFCEQLPDVAKALEWTKV